MIRIYKKMGPTWGVSAGLGQIGLTGFLIFLGLLPFIVIGAALYFAIWGLALLLCLVLAAYGVTYKHFTGRDARVPVSGSESGKHPLELWMIKHGWIRIGGK